MQVGYFLGSCKVCGRVCSNNRSLALHLRMNSDEAHQKLKLEWKSAYQRLLTCRKCGESWVIEDPSQKNEKRCPRCREQRSRLGKRAYEKLPTFDKPQNPTLPQLPASSNAEEAAIRFEAGEKIIDILRDLGLSYKKMRSFLESRWGKEEYRKRCLARKIIAARVAQAAARKIWAESDPEGKARLIEARFGKTRQLELGFASHLLSLGLRVEMNKWQSLLIGGKWSPREADIKIDLGNQKVVILCDGEAFHGPGAIFGSVECRITDDLITAEAYFDAGYSVFRYSETEIHSGVALEQFSSALADLRQGVRVIRLWHPKIERRI